MVSPLLGLDGTADHSADLNGIRCFLTLPTHQDQSQVIKQKTALNMDGCSSAGAKAATEVHDSSLESSQKISPIFLGSRGATNGRSFPGIREFLAGFCTFAAAIKTLSRSRRVSD